MAEPLFEIIYVYFTSFYICFSHLYFAPNETTCASETPVCKEIHLTLTVHLPCVMHSICQNFIDFKSASFSSIPKCHAWILKICQRHSKSRIFYRALKHSPGPACRNVDPSFRASCNQRS